MAIKNKHGEGSIEKNITLDTIRQIRNVMYEDLLELKLLPGDAWPKEDYTPLNLWGLALKAIKGGS